MQERAWHAFQQSALMEIKMNGFRADKLTHEMAMRKRLNFAA